MKYLFAVIGVFCSLNIDNGYSMKSFLDRYYKHSGMFYQSITPHKENSTGSTLEKVIIIAVKVSGKLEDLGGKKFILSHRISSGNTINLSKIHLPDHFIREYQSRGLKHITLEKSLESMSITLTAKKSASSFRFPNDTHQFEMPISQFELCETESDSKPLSELLKQDFYHDFYVTNPQISKLIKNDFSQNNYKAINAHLIQLTRLLKSSVSRLQILDEFKNLIGDAALLENLDFNSVKEFQTELTLTMLQANDQERLGHFIKIIGSSLIKPLTANQEHLIESQINLLKNNFELLSPRNKAAFSILKNRELIKGMMTVDATGSREVHLQRSLGFILSEVESGYMNPNTLTHLITCIDYSANFNLKQQEQLHSFMKILMGRPNIKLNLDDRNLVNTSIFIGSSLEEKPFLLPFYLPIINELDRIVLDGSPEHFNAMKNIKNIIHENLQKAIELNSPALINDLLSFIKPVDIFDYNKLSSFKREMLDCLVKCHDALPQDSQIMLKAIKLDQIQGLILSHADVQVEAIFKDLKDRCVPRAKPLSMFYREQIKLFDILINRLSFVNGKYLDDLVTQVIANDCRSSDVDGIQSHFNHIHELLREATGRRTLGDSDFGEANHAAVSRARFYVAQLDLHQQNLSQVFKDQLDYLIKVNNLMSLPVYSA